MLADTLCTKGSNLNQPHVFDIVYEGLTPAQIQALPEI